MVYFSGDFRGTIDKTHQRVKTVDPAPDQSQHSQSLIPTNISPPHFYPAYVRAFKHEKIRGAQQMAFLQYSPRLIMQRLYKHPFYRYAGINNEVLHRSLNRN